MTATPNTSTPLWLDRSANGIVRHWVAILNAGLILFAALPWIAPLLQSAGYARLGGLIFRLYSWCHQRPERSFFLSGYQVCYCHRCTALYSSLAVAGLLFGLFRWQRALPTRALLLAAVPMLIDGLWHMANDVLPGWGLRSAMDDIGSVNWWARMVTGALFGAAAVLWAYPRFAHELRNV